MLSENDRQNLLGNLSRNRVVLVTGAGFSCDAKNVTGSNLPIGLQLAKALWEFLYGTNYDGKTNLKTLYGAAQTNPKGKKGLRQFFQTHLHATEIPEWYKQVPRWFWRRIYSFNADDLFESVSKEGKVQLDVIVAPAPYSERDSFLRSLQYVKLHGCINSDKELTFGPRDYGIRAAARTDIWYLHFVEDYSTFPTIFVGTELDEPIFWQYVESRGSGTVKGAKVRRPKCFLVSPSISKPYEELLEQYNIISVRHNAGAFFQWLAAQESSRSREDVLRLVNPDLEPALRLTQAGATEADAITTEYFLSVFRIPVRPMNPRRSAMFLLGVPPTWDDIANDIDAHRKVDDDLTAALLEAIRTESTDVVVVHSTAGGGKSTICKRVALELVDRGHSVYFSDGTRRPEPARVAAYLQRTETPCVLFFDNAGDDLLLIAELLERVRDNRFKPLIVIAARSNDFAYKQHELLSVGARVLAFPIPDLCDEDIEAILATLEAHHVLGKLREKSHEARVHEFKVRARKQILVAMREATSGRGFDEILHDEYEKVQPDSAKLLYLVAALASDGAYGMTTQQMITALNLPPDETLYLIQQNLNGVLIRHEHDPSIYFIRHPAIASFIISNAPRDRLAEAIIALLISISTVLPQGYQRRTSRAFRLYRNLLSHSRMYFTFPNGPKLPREIYEGIKEYYRNDGHYWLHYASYEIEHGGNISLAENFLAQSEALIVHHRQIDTAKAHLLFRKSILAPNAAEAKNFMERALKILREHLADQKTVSLHALHIFGSQMIEYIWKWVPTMERSAAFKNVGRELQRATPEWFRSEVELGRMMSEIKKSELETVIRPR